MFVSMESRLIRRYWQDGLLDLMAGLALIAIGVAWRYDLVALGPIVPALLVTLWSPLRRRWIEPLSGYVEFSGRRQRKTRRFLSGTIWAGIGALVIAVAIYLLRRAPLTNPIHWVAGLPAALLSLLALATAFLTHQPRFLVYGGVLLASGSWVAVTQGRPEAAMLLSGAVVSLAGFGLLLRFRAAARTGQSES